MNDPSGMAVLKANGISKAYGAKTALSGVGFSCAAGELIGLIGQNGAGKTTLLNILAGRLAPSSGDVQLNGRDVLWEPEKTRPMIGYLPEKPGLYDEMTVQSQLLFVCRLKGVIPEDTAEHIRELAEKTGITDVMGRRIGNLSKGYRQRVGLAAALAGNPSVILLDEPTTGLDPVQIREIRGLIRSLARECLVILSTHILKDLDGLCTRALMLQEGRLIRDLRVSEAAQTERTLRIRAALGRDAAERLLSQLKTVSRFEIMPGHVPGEAAALITGAPDAPMERELFQALSKADTALLELSPVRSELEELFVTALTDRAAEEQNE